MSTPETKPKGFKIRKLWISLFFGFIVLNLIAIDIAVNSLQNIQQLYPTLLDHTQISYHILWFILVLAIFSNIVFFFYIILTKFITFKKKEVIK